MSVFTSGYLVVFHESFFADSNLIVNRLNCNLQTEGSRLGPA